MMSLQDRIATSRKLMKNPYAYLNESGGFSASIEDTEHRLSLSRQSLQNPYAHMDEIESIGDIVSQKKSSYSLFEIEQKARSLQLMMWQDRARIWADNVPDNPIEILDPEIALKLVGYDYGLEETLGHFHSEGKQLEVAGIIDGKRKRVHISRQLAPNVRKFTLAHELAHAMLHEEMRMHRDRPLNGESISRKGAEYEADKFASFFLMPRKLLRATFKRYFLMDRFSLNEATAYALGLGDLLAQKDKFKSVRQLSRLIASAEQYNGVHFNSLAKQFGVSIETMAIRLEELNLIAGLDS